MRRAQVHRLGVQERLTEGHAGIVLSLVLFLATSAVAAETDFTLTSSGSQLQLKVDDGSISWKSLDILRPGGQTAWIDPSLDVPMWTVTLSDAKGEKHTLTALDGVTRSWMAGEDRVEIEWGGLQPGGLRVLASVTVQGEDLLWDLEVEVHETDYALWDITYPEIGPLAITDSVHSILPYGWGVLRKELTKHRDEGVYPSARRAMPFVGVSDGQTGLYVGTNDRKGYAMRLFVGGRTNQPIASIGIRHDIEGIGQAKHYKIPYSVVTTPYIGDWYEAARLYREDAMETPWGSVPPLAERDDIPDWLLDTDLWYLGSCHDETTANQAIEFAKHFEVPVSAHIYTWHQIAFDDKYPEYFPAKPGFKKAVQKVQQAGIAVMPYINGRLWDSSTDSWKEKNAEEYCSINEEGKRYEEVYGTSVPLSPMCPSTPLWQSVVENLVDRLLNDVGVSAVYIDQISAASAKRCFAKDHGHPVGGGTHWVQGYREMLERCLKLVPPGAALTTEENADPWNDQLQAWLLVNTRRYGGTIVPLYPAVYGGRAISFGFQYLAADDAKYRYPFRLKMAQAFVFGSQLGWVGHQILGEKYTTEAAFLKNLCLARHDSRDALQYGELLPPVVLDGGGSVSWTSEKDDKETDHTEPAVHASAWLTLEGKRVLAFANVSDEERTVTIRIDRRHLDTATAGKTRVRLQERGGTAAGELRRENGNYWGGTVSVPAAGTRILELARN